MRKADFRYPPEQARNFIEDFAQFYHFPFEMRILNDGLLTKYVLTTSSKDETVLNVYFTGNGSSSSIAVEKGDESIILELLEFVSQGKSVLSRVGIDEAGKGDYFGPLVIAAVGVAEDKEVVLRSKGVADSKDISDNVVKKIARDVRQLCPYDVVAIGPQKYNELYSEFRNLNRMLAWGHARALENVLKQGDFKIAISDRFSSRDTLKKSLMDKGRLIELIERHRAESDTAVAAASVLARAEFLGRLEKLSREAGISLPKGCSEAVKSAGRKLVEKLGGEALGEYAKLHFKTTAQITGK